MRASRRVRGAYLLVLIVVLMAATIATYVFGRTYRTLALQKAPFGRLAYVPSFDPIEDVSLGVPMDSGNNAPATSTKDIRAIEVFPSQVVMLAGGHAHRVIDLKRPVSTLHDLVHLVNEPSWISERSTVVTLDAAVIDHVGNTMSVAAPVTTEVVMTVRQGVFLAANQATLTLSGVYFHASDHNTPVAGSRAAQRADLGRPFILATTHSTMTITNSTFRYLGRDWNSSYGVAWSKDSSGSVSGSVFEHNFIGIYTEHSIGLRIQHNRFYYNSLYGVDPHSGSSHLLVEYNISNYNGRHGIIFSDHVTDGIVRYNVTKANGLNGIMMDEASTSNKIDHNIVSDNKSDGIVLAESDNNEVAYNTITGNRVGVHIRGETEPKNAVFRNTIANNDMAAQGSGLSGNNSYGNGGQWTARRIASVWLTALALLVALMAITRMSRRGRDRRQTRSSRRQTGLGMA